MQRGTWNVRPGAGIALNLTDTDGDGEFDTTTIVATGAGGSGSGSGGTGARYPVQSVNSGSASSTTRVPVLGATPTNGNTLILVSLQEGTDAVSSVVTTNVTWSLVAQTTAGVAPVIEIWKGVVAASASATTTVTYGASAFHNAIVMEWASLAGTLDASATRHVTTDPTGSHPIAILTATVVSALVIAATSTISNSTQFSAFSGAFMAHLLTATCGVQYGFPGTNPVYGITTGGSSATTSAITVSLT
jgi:hypothetical protein